MYLSEQPTKYPNIAVLDCCFHPSLTPIQSSKSFPSIDKNYSFEQEEFRKMQLHQYFHPF
jgi:hypothetical protein